ncbi:MAG: SDR family NAD(P)-dependent oxidoreductase [Pseudomonadota bacterium]
MAARGLDGKVALVTGCGSMTGIGAASARCLARDGAHVIVTDRIGADAEAVAAGIPGAVARALDVTDRAQIDAAVAAAVADHGRLDILVNNAATTQGAKPFLEVTAEDWETSFAVNIKGTAACCQAAIPALCATQGVIINLSSMARIGAQRAFGAYTTAKHALIGMTKTIAAEFGPQGLRAVAICPGFISTGMHEGVNQRMADEQGVTLEDIHAQRYATVALKRAGTPEEVAELIAFTASPAAAYITGVALPVTGGVQMGL